jgi:hypothetical protein
MNARQHGFCRPSGDLSVDVEASNCSGQASAAIGVPGLLPVHPFLCPSFCWGYKACPYLDGTFAAGLFDGGGDQHSLPFGILGIRCGPPY